MDAENVGASMVRLRLSKNSCRGEHCSPVQRGSRRGDFGSMPSIDPYTVGADSISARKLCGCRYVPRATNGRPYRAVILLLFPMRTMRFPMYSPWRWVPVWVRTMLRVVRGKVQQAFPAVATLQVVGQPERDSQVARDCRWIPNDRR